MLTKQKDLLLERLADFESTNRTLRRMLRERHEQEAAGLRLSEQRDVLLKKLTETEDENQVGKEEENWGTGKREMWSKLHLEKFAEAVVLRLQITVNRFNFVALNFCRF